jgi:integrase
VANKTAQIFLHITKHDGKRTYARAAFAKNGRLRPFVALVDGSEEHHSEGTYYVRWYEGKQQKYQSCGKDPSLAVTVKVSREQILETKRLGIAVIEPQREHRIKLADSILKYLERVRARRSHKTQNEFELMLPQFQEMCSKTYLDEITTEDLENFALGLRRLGLSDRTVANRVARVTCFLKAQGITGLVTEELKRELRYDEKEVDAYTHEQIDALFAAANHEQRLIFQFFLCTGFREAEVAHATWRDVDFERNKIKARIKVKPGATSNKDRFRTKDRAERSIPLPDDLMEQLRMLRSRNRDSLYIFPNRDGRANGHFLRTLKDIAFRAGLNCCECVSRKAQSCAEHPVCDQWQLHKFRRTFATFHHESGVSARTIQRWLGHSDLETTLRYLAGADDESDQTRQQVNNTFAFTSAIAEPKYLT